MQDLESHGKEFGLYSKWKGGSLKGFEQDSKTR